MMAPRVGRLSMLRVCVPLAALAVAAAACGGGGGTGNGGGAPASGATGGGEGETLTVAKNAKLGAYLTDEQGRAVYLFEKDTNGQSACSGACASAWPPVSTSAAPKATGGVGQGMLGTTGRAGGTKQVTYGGHPLYYYAADGNQPGSTKGHDIEQFGAEWYLVSPQGQKVEGQQGDTGGTGEDGGYGGY